MKIKFFVLFTLSLFLFFVDSNWATEADKKPINSNKDSRIHRFLVGDEGNLHIYFNNGKDYLISKERGRYSSGEDVLIQEGFENIQLADDGYHLGWLASYMVCAQSYPCTPELAIIDIKKDIKYIVPPNGVIWDWMFINGGKQIVIHHGFPHGDANGVFSLYDTGSGDKQAEYSSFQNSAPIWVKNLANKYNSPTSLSPAE